MRIDFFGNWPHFIDHMAPIYKRMDEPGDFFVPPNLEEYLANKGIVPTVMDAKEVAPRGNNPLLVAGHGNLQTSYLQNHGRKLILMEHGPGITFPNNPSYAGSVGWRRKADLTLAPNHFTYIKTQKAIPDMKQHIIGTPMLDPWACHFGIPRGDVPDKPTVTISFHWDGSRVAPEAGNAFRHYKGLLPILAKESGFNLIAHGHPRNLETMRKTYENLGIEVVPDFIEMMNRTDVLINDSSSIVYLFLVTGNPVILLNAPWFRKDVNFGLRFWDHTDIGEQVEKTDQVLGAIERAINDPFACWDARKRAVEEIFPYFGYSAVMAARSIRKYYELLH